MNLAKKATALVVLADSLTEKSADLSNRAWAIQEFLKGIKDIAEYLEEVNKGFIEGLDELIEELEQKDDE